MVFIVTRKPTWTPSCTSCTVGVENSFQRAVKCIVGEMFAGGGAAVQHYLRRNRYLRNDKEGEWIDIWLERKGTDDFTIQKWTPGEADATDTWVSHFDKWFKVQVLENGWSDADIIEEWKLVEDAAVRQAGMDVHMVHEDHQEDFVTIVASIQERNAWIEEYGHASSLAY